MGLTHPINTSKNMTTRKPNTVVHLVWNVMLHWKVWRPSCLWNCWTCSQRDFLSNWIIHALCKHICTVLTHFAQHVYICTVPIIKLAQWQLSYITVHVLLKEWSACKVSTEPCCWCQHSSYFLPFVGILPMTPSAPSAYLLCMALEGGKLVHIVQCEL